MKMVRKDSTREEINEQQRRDESLKARGCSVPRSLRPSTERDRVITEQMWKAKQIATRLAAQTGLPYSELHSEALMHICRIYETWDPSKSNFSTWVNRNLPGLCYNYLRDRSRLVRLPRRIIELNLRVNKLRKERPELTLVELADIIGCSEYTLVEVEQAVQVVHSLDWEWNRDDDE